MSSHVTQSWCFVVRDDATELWIVFVRVSNQNFVLLFKGKRDKIRERSLVVKSYANITS